MALSLGLRSPETPGPMAQKLTALEGRRQSPVAQLWEDFWEFDDSWPSEFFPAFVLARRPGLLHHLQLIPALQHPANQAMIALLRCRQNNESEIDARQQLQFVNPLLLQLYLQGRG